MGHDHPTNGRHSSDAFELAFDAWGRLVLTDPGGQYVGVEPVRAFPISDPEHGLALCDARGHELVWIEDLAGLPAAVRRVLDEALARREFVPVVRRVVSVSAPVEPSEWEVETDRGRTRFLLNSEDDIRPLGDYRALLVDVHGIRYLIADTRRLDPVSRRLLERYL